MNLVQNLLFNYFSYENQNGNKEFNKQIEKYKELGYNSNDFKTEAFQNGIYAIGHYFQYGANKLGEAFKWSWDKFSTELNNYLNMNVQWICYGENPCSFCQTLDGKIFKVYRIPAQHPHCKCGLIPIENRLTQYLQYPGNDPLAKPEGDFVWQGRGDVASRQGMWVNNITGEKWREDLNHPEPTDPHWDYWDKYSNHFRVYEDSRVEYVE